jgi:hypothetical protein
VRGGPVKTLILSLLLLPLIAIADEAPKAEAPKAEAQKEKQVAKESFWLEKKGPSTNVELFVPDVADWDGGAYEVARFTQGKTGTELKLPYGRALEVKVPKGVIIKHTKYVDLIALDSKGTRRALVFERLSPPGPAEYVFVALDKKGSLIEMARVSGQIARITDYDHDGSNDILMKGGIAEPGAYAPYLVFRQAQTTGTQKFELDEQLSKRWSAENHYEWHGSKYREDIVVDEHGKEKEVPAKN